MARARYKKVVDAMAADIRAGKIAPGTRLPTHRELAAREGLALVTASRVYAELSDMGLVSGETGRGMFVRESTLTSRDDIVRRVFADDVVDLNFNYPSLPEQAGLLRNALRALASSGDLDALLRYQPHGGRMHERASAALYLEDRGVGVPADRVLLVSGAQHGLAVAALALLQPGDVVAVDALTYPGFKVLAQSLRLELAPLPAAIDGPDLDALDRLCATRRVRAIYVMPTLHNPLGWVSPERSRLRLVEIAREHGLVILEDASYAYLVEHAPEPLAVLAPESTVYVSGLSKSVATGLRVGFVVTPTQFIETFERVIRATTWNTPALMTAIATGWINDGTVARLEAQKRDDAARRQAVARAVLDGLEFVGHPCSYFLWLPLPGGARADQVASKLMRDNVSVSTAEPFATSKHSPHAIRLALGSVDMDVLQRSVETVKRVIEHYAC
ncbi:PLP-dependent aminotransferase family protein [Mycobacterium aquaticum]|uniref:GntR family transcriptional regulator n=1 Tax=Mycobacterium aquaticum TaxID=1927124 RepID=A0A1X0APU6_9MYCO|nr:PLP-dependent aminotransferase family protein [Mycobacterium aquaticum]ORA32081.1 GntR family transcriptional regulator [Mycobacterium aquaticum]